MPIEKKTCIATGITITLILGAYVFSQKLEAQEFQKIDVTTAQVNKFGVCRNVINTGTLPILAPLKTKEEWCALIKADPNLPNLSLTTCQSCSWVQNCGCGNCAPTLVCDEFNVGSCP